MCPLLVSGVVAAIIGIVQLSIRVWPPDPHGFRAGLGDPQSRLNRISRFTVWIGLLQWAQMFQFVFPLWTRAVVGFSKLKKLIIGLSFSVLVPISLTRCLQWMVVITPPSNIQLASVLYSLSGVSWDCVLMVSWTLVMFTVAREILGSRDLLALAGWRREAFVNERIWNGGSTLLKFGYLFACVLIFLRSFLNPSKGFSYGQNDLVVLTVSYPLLMVMTWWSTNSTLVLLKRKFSGLAVVLFGPLAAFLCRVSGIDAPGAIAGFWIYLIRVFVRRFKRVPEEPQKSTTEKDFVKSVLQISMPVTYMYGLLLLVLSLLSLLQHHLDVSPPNEYLTVVRPDDQTVAVRHTVSEMQLFTTKQAPLKRRQDPPDLPIYGICGKDFWGLNIVDYGLFSMMSYVGDPHLTEKTVREIFPSDWNISVAIPNEEVFWSEFNVNNKTTVIAVRGSEFWRVSDYLEDLRMWTEPVAKSMLTLAFPTVRAWSPKTTAMVFDAYQEFLAFIGIPDDMQYKYQRLLEYVERKKFDHQVVLTGHSLGAGVASIVGAIAKLPTVTFLSPGMYQTANKFFYHSSKNHRQFAELVHNQSVSIQVENDFVGKYLDNHAGLVQTITCSVDHLAPLTCHLIDNCICNLVRHCKDPRWPGGCDFRYDFDIFLNATFPEESYKSLRRSILEPITRKLNHLFSISSDDPDVEKEL
jgi:lipase ATG15